MTYATQNQMQEQTTIATLSALPTELIGVWLSHTGLEPATTRLEGDETMICAMQILWLEQSTTTFYFNKK
jgi:hypothetical protein